MAGSVGEGMVRSRAGVTRTPEGGCRSIYMSRHLVAGWCIGKIGMGNGVGFCRCRCRCIKHGGWGAQGELMLVRAAIRRSGVFWWWRWRRWRRRQRLPHMVGGGNAYQWGVYVITAYRCMDGGEIAVLSWWQGVAAETVAGRNKTGCG